MTHASIEQSGAPVVPVIRYRNLPAAINWLCAAFGFEKHRITADSSGTIIFAQLTFGPTMIMVGPVRDSAFDRFLKQPDEIGGAETQVCYFRIADAHAHCARARAAGAQIVFDIEDRGNGGRSYSCRDIEGRLWNFGTYDPWQRQAMVARDARPQPRISRRWKQAGCSVLLVALGVAIVIPQHGTDAVDLPSFASIETASISRADMSAGGVGPKNDAGRVGEPDAEAGALAVKDDAVDPADLREQLARATRKLDAAEQAAVATRYQLARAKRDAREARRQLARERDARTRGSAGAPWTSPAQ
jgi:uncharacterized glyoxalase superfamily protein PhnB